MCKYLHFMPLRYTDDIIKVVQTSFQFHISKTENIMKTTKWPVHSQNNEICTM